MSLEFSRDRNAVNRAVLDGKSHVSGLSEFGIFCYIMGPSGFEIRFDVKAQLGSEPYSDSSGKTYLWLIPPQILCTPQMIL